MSKRLSTLWILPLIATLACSGGSRSAPETTPEPATPAAAATPETIPLDPAVVHGKLDNGFTYYIRTNQKPEKRAELRLVVNAGSVLEDDDQRGLAHFVEHMAFNGTEHFGKQDLIDYLEGIGMDFGPEINAYTSFDETVYMLTIPTDVDEIVGTAFQILEDWAHLVSFEDEEIDKERGVVVEEWRLGRGAWGRIRDQQFPVTFHGSRYADRIVIGDREILETAPPDAVRRYYRDWYRPDLMAVIAVGDFDAATIEGLIREHFSRVPAVVEPREREEFPIPGHEETLTSIVTDPEATSINITVGYKRPPVPNRTVEDLRERLVDSLYHGMMNDRLNELTQKADPPFQYGFASSGWLGRTKSMYRLGAAVRDGGVERGLETILVEANRVEEYGFQESELERAKVDLLRRIERWYEERDKQESRSFAGRYAQHFLEGDPAPSIEYYRDTYNELVPGITLAEINARADQWITEDNRVILVSGPDKEEAGIPEEAGVLAVFDDAAAVAVIPWVDQVRDEPLVASAPEPGKVVSEETIEELNVTRWKLSNGVTVLLKPTDFKNDEIRLRGYSPGGDSLVSDDDYMSASFASNLVGEMGLGNFSSIELGKALAGKVARSRPGIRELSEGVSASASPKDLETMFQLLYLGFTAPRRDEESYQAFLTQREGWLENQEASPGYWFRKEFRETLNQNHPRRRMLTQEAIEKVDLDRALAVYRDRFADASDFLFTMVGNFEVNAIRPIVETWLGGLPSTGRVETWRDIGVERPEGVHSFEVRSGIEPKSSVRINFHGEAEWSPLNAHILSSMTHAMRIRLREVMREDMGGVYGVRVGGGISRYPKERYSITVSFGCDPERVEELVAAVFTEIDEVKRDGPGDENVDKVRESQARERETDVEENAFWLGTLEYHERNGLDLLDILRYDEMIEAVTAEALQEAAQRYFDTERYVQGVLYPEESVETAVSEEAATGGGS